MSDKPRDLAAASALRAGLEIYLFVVVLAMFPYTSDPTGDIKYMLLAWSAFLLAAGWLTAVWLGRTVWRRPPLFWEILLLFLGWNLAASLRSEYPGLSLADFRTFWALFLLYLVASQVYRTPDHVRRTLLVVCAAVAISSLYALLLQRTGRDFFPWSETTSDIYTNLPATFGNPNYAAHTLILAFIMALFLATRRSMAWCVLFAGLFLVHHRFTHQRGGLVALAAAAAVVAIGWTFFRRTKRPVRATVTTLVLVGVLAAAGLAGVMGLNKLRTGVPYPIDLSLLVRYKSYCSAARMVLERPILGYGTGVYKVAYPPFWTPYEQKWFAQEMKMNAHVHNDLLEVAVDAGLPAAGFYLAFLVLGACFGLYLGLTRSDAGERRLGFMFAALFVAFLVDGLFGFNLRVPVSASLLFVLAGALEGVWAGLFPAAAAPAASRRFTGVWQGALFAAAAVAVVLDTGVFISQILYHRGSAQLHWQRFDAAERSLRWGERLAPWNAQFARECGAASLGMQRWAEAETHLERSLQKNPNYLMTLVTMGRAKLSAGIALAASAGGAGAAQDKLAEGGAYLQRALALCPGFALAEECLGRIAAARALALSQGPGAAGAARQIEDCWREAEMRFTTSLQSGAKASGDAATYRQLAQVRMALQNTAGAEDAMALALQADPSDDANLPLFHQLAKANGHEERFRNAVLWRIERLNDQKPADPDRLATSYLWLARVEEEFTHDLAAAEADYRVAAGYATNRPEVWSAYARFAEANHRQDALRDLVKEIGGRVGPEAPLPHVMALAQVLEGGPGALLDASVILVQAVQGKRAIPVKRPADLDMKWALALLAEELEKAQLPPRDAGLILMHLAMASAGAEDYATAARLYPLAMAGIAENLRGVCAQYWADALVRLRRIDEAVNLLRDTLAQNPGDGDVHLALARSLRAGGRRAEARAEYERLLGGGALSAEDRHRVERELEDLAAP